MDRNHNRPPARKFFSLLCFLHLPTGLDRGK
jgi:hypothetical protein